jgi:hypothetical protein
MTRILIGVVLAFAALAPAATSTAGERFPPYIVENGIAFGIYANRDWRAVGTPDAVVEKAAIDRGPVPSKDRSFMVWTKNCRPGQTLTFERTLYFIGRPFTLSGFTQTGLDVATWDIFFNGKKVAHLLKRVQPIFSPSDRKLIKFGDNTIRYVVRLSNAPDACTDDARPGRRGVWFSLTGNNLTDMAVTRPPRANVFHHGREYLQPIEVKNRGRANVTGAVLTVTMASHVACLEFRPDNTCKEWMFNIDTLFSDLPCKRSFGADPNDRRVMECRIDVLLSGESADVQIRMGFRPGTPDWVMQENRLTWEVKALPGSTGESPSTNNKGEIHVIYCQHGKGANGCKPPPPP